MKYFLSKAKLYHSLLSICRVLMSFGKKSNTYEELTLLQLMQVTLILVTRSVVYRTAAKEVFLNLRLVWDWQWEESDLPHCCLFPNSMGVEPPNLWWKKVLEMCYGTSEGSTHIFIRQSWNRQSFMVDINQLYYPEANTYIIEILKLQQLLKA